MQRIYQQPPGIDFDSIVVGANLQIGSLIVNNPTGAWLWCEQTNEFIPPYTLNWARTLTPTASRATFRWIATGPDGTVSIYLGDPATINLYDDATGGMSNGQPFTPLTRRRVVTGTMPVAASLTNIGFIGGDLGRHIRSILVDNPSQSWLQLGTYLDAIPPNTVGWGKVLPDAPTSITITALPVGPDGSPSVALGDPPTVTLLDDLSSGNVQGAPYVPVARKRIVATVAFGNLGVTAFVGADAGRFVAGFIVDNPSGSWLTVTVGGAAYRIAPYTMQWVKRVDPPAANVTSLTFDAAGPSGQVSTLVGDQVTLTILDQPPDTPDTSGFISGFTPVLTVTRTANVRVTVGDTALLVAGVAGRRIRLRTFDVILGGFPGVPPVRTDTGIQFQIGSSVTFNPNFGGRVETYIGSTFRAFPDGVPFPTGEGIRYNASTDLHDILVSVIVTYEVI